MIASALRHWASASFADGLFAFTSDAGLVNNVWDEVNAQLGNYVRGKALEIVIVWIVAYIVFSLLGLKYAMLLSALVGFSVLVPYIGAFGMTVPVMLVAYAQWGVEAQTFYVLIAYGILQMLDGNLLVPVLFSEAVDLHPVAIITAVLFFGGIWGFWGVFFAIPLATVVHAVIKAWPRKAAVLPELATGVSSTAAAALVPLNQEPTQPVAAVVVLAA